MIKKDSRALGVTPIIWNYAAMSLTRKELVKRRNIAKHCMVWPKFININFIILYVLNSLWNGIMEINITLSIILKLRMLRHAYHNLCLMFGTCFIKTCILRKFGEWSFYWSRDGDRKCDLSRNAENKLKL